MKREEYLSRMPLRSSSVNETKKLLSGEAYYDNIEAMMRKFEHITRMFFLFLYAVYALTPIHMYAMDGCGGVSGLLHGGKHTSTDIVWANVLYSFLVDDGDAPSEGDRISTDAQPVGDVVLVKKRRALFREQTNIKPLFNIEILPPSGLGHTPVRPAEYETTKDPLMRETEVCLVLNTGLSPPSLILS
jgi:hypothetical protein